MVFLTTVSWEGRFLGGLKHVMQTESPGSVVLFYYDQWESRTNEYRQKAVEVCSRVEGRDVIEVPLRYGDPEASWKTIRETIRNIEAKDDEVLIDISTMPREGIWGVLLNLEAWSSRVRYLYSRPKKYGAWLSRDPGTPRLALKLGGEMRFGGGTVLVIVTGFDSQRTGQLVRTFDPDLVHLAIQTGQQFENERRNVEGHKDALIREGEGCRVEELGIDAYAPGHGFDALADVVEQHVGEANVIMTSLGPKPSAVALYRVQRRFRQVGLVYSPSDEYNVEYSEGIGKMHTWELLP